MLGADHVLARRRKDRLELTRITPDRRERALALATAYLAIAAAHVGRAREEVDDAREGVDVDPRDRKVAAGLWKLVDDACEYDAKVELAPAEVRSSLFLRAAAARRDADAIAGFDRAGVLEGEARGRGVDADAIERALYADLRAAHVLTRAPCVPPSSLVDAWIDGQPQAILLRAVRVTVDVRCESPAAYRAIFRKLKFLRLLFRVEPLPDGGYRLAIDGPMSLFESSTKYGLQLALAWPLLRAADAWSLEAEVRWGLERAPLVFAAEGRGAAAEDAPSPLPDEVEALVAAVNRVGGEWRAERSTHVFPAGSLGCIVPDVELIHGATGRSVHVEVLGFWSREAVFRRLDLVRGGFPHPIVFAVSERLRVRDETLDDEGPGALYVYKGAMSARSLLDRAARVSSRA